MGQIFGNVDTIDGPVFLNCRRMTESGPAVALGQVDGPFGKLNNLGPLKFRHAQQVVSETEVSLSRIDVLQGYSLLNRPATTQGFQPYDGRWRCKGRWSVVPLDHRLTVWLGGLGL